MTLKNVRHLLSSGYAGARIRQIDTRPFSAQKCPVKRQRIETVLTALFFFCAVTGPSWAANGAGIEKKIISVTDIHFTPFSDPSLGKALSEHSFRQWDRIFSQSTDTAPSTYNNETNPILFRRLLKSMKQKSGGVFAVVFTGDILAHNFNDMVSRYTGADSDYDRNRFIFKTIAYVTSKMRATFGGVPIYFSLGNNDSYNGDYALVDDGEFLHTTADLFFDNLIKTPQSKTDFYSTFPEHGYYSVPFRIVKNGRLIGLNTIFFSTRYTPAKGTDPGKVELDWFEKELSKARAAKERVWLLLHIPPGVNVYNTQHNNSTGQAVDVGLFWQTGYNQRYLALITKYRDVIVTAFAGHTHMDDFRLISSTNNGTRQASSFIRISPSVSPVFGNNPSFQVIRIDPRTGTLNDETIYYMDLAKSRPVFEQEYTFTQTYGVAPNLSGLAPLNSALRTNRDKRNSYIERYPVSSSESTISDVWQWYWCGIGNLTQTNYIKTCKPLLGTQSK